MILECNGPEGSGKSTLMTYVALLHAAAGLPVLCFPGYDLFYKGQKISKTVKVEDWVTFSEESRSLLTNSMLCIDELQNYFDRMSYADLKSRLFSSLGAQRRKMNMAIVYTVQNTSWVYGRLSWLAHVKAQCYDLFWSPWGKSENLKRGELLRIDMIDMKGFFTGEEFGQIGSFRLQSKELWPSFRSYDPVSPWEGITKLELKRPKMTLSFDGQGEAGASDGTVPEGTTAPNENPPGDLWKNMGKVTDTLKGEQND